MDLRLKEVHRIEKNLKKVPKSLKMLSFAFLIYTLAWGSIIPYFSIFLSKTVANYSQVGFIIALMSIVAAITSIVMGDLIDKVGRKKIILFSFANYLLIGPLYALTHSVNVLILARVYNGIAAIGVWVPSITYVRDISPCNKRAEYMGYFYTASSISYCVGPLIGAVIVSFVDMKYLFYALALGALVAAGIINKLPETIKPKRSMFQGIKDVLFKDRFIEKELKDYVNEKGLGVKVTMVSFLTKMVSAVLVMVLALYINNMGGSLWQIGLIYFVMYLPFVFQFAFGDIADHVGAGKMLSIGAMLSSVFLVALFFATNIMAIVAFSFVVGVGLAIIGPVISIYISKMAKRNRGEITGIYGAVDKIAAFTGPIMAGLIADMYGLNFAFVFAAIAMFLVIGVALRIR
ncbi:MAG: MFS transporter [archaeon]|nr:MFS transporter [archaeon]